MLTVVEHQQQVLALQEPRQPLCHRHTLWRRVAHRGRDRVGQVVGIEHLRELAEPDAVRIVRQQLGADLEREAGLAHATHAHDRDHPRRPHPVGDRSQVVLATDEGAELVRQVRAVRVQGPQRRERGRQARSFDLEQVHRGLQVAQPVLPEIEQPDPLAHLLADDTGAQDLAAVRDRGHPRRPVHVGPEPVPVALRRLSRVQAHPHPQLQWIGPCGRAQRSLRGDRRADTVMGGPERRQRAVAGALHDLPSMTLDRGAHQAVVVSERSPHRGGMLLPQARSNPPDP